MVFKANMMLRPSALFNLRFRKALNGTDVRAIRDATAHGRFKIHMLGNDWMIEFDNDEEGYSFCKRFSQKEFTKFFDMHTLLYKLQLHLLVILELLPILATHFHKQS